MSVEWVVHWSGGRGGGREGGGGGSTLAVANALHTVNSRHAMLPYHIWSYVVM